MDQRLRVIGGPDKGLSFQLPQAGSETLGKSRQHNEICLHDPAVARVHCQVEMEDGRVVLSDFDSDTGTFVNGSRITQQELKHGDVVKIGDTELQFQSIGGPAPGAAARPPKTPDPAASTAPLASPAPSQTTPPGDLSALTGTTLAHYELGPFLGRGYFGAVYRVHDRKEDRTVALKVLSADFPKGEQESQQFVQSIKAAVQVRHPNLITVFGAGRTAANYWVAMEYVEGESLAGVLQLTNTPGTSDWRSAFRLAVHLARALYFIHENRLLHRNITPQNILLRNIDRQTKLGDLFLSKALAGSSLRQSVLRTKLANELPYLCPEQTVPNAATDALGHLRGRRGGLPPARRPSTLFGKLPGRDDLGDPRSSSPGAQASKPVDPGCIRARSFSECWPSLRANAIRPWATCSRSSRASIPSRLDEVRQAVAEAGLSAGTRRWAKAKLPNRTPTKERSPITVQPKNGIPAV